MPHVVPKTKTTRSPADVDGPLDLIAKARGGSGINLLGITTDAVEHNGTIGFLVEDDDLDDLVAALADYEPQLFREADGQHLDYLTDRPGALLAAIRRGRRHHRGGQVREIGVGVRPRRFFVYADDPADPLDPDLPQRDDLVREPADGKPGFDPNVDASLVGTPVEDDGRAATIAQDQGRAIEPTVDTFPVSIYYAPVASRDERTGIRNDL